MPLPALAAVAALATFAHLVRRAPLGSRAGGVEPQPDVPDEVLDRYSDLSSILSDVQADIRSTARSARMNLSDSASSLMQDMLEFQGFTVLGRGGGRVVVDLGSGYVAKLASWQGGRNQNKREFKIWNSAKGELREMLVPILRLDEAGSMVLVPRVVPVDDLLHAADRTQAKEAEDMLGQAMSRIRPLMPEAIVDSNFDFNWGFHDGKLKLLDYGQ